MEGKALSPDELGRIYAYIWRDQKEKGTLKDKFERDPASVIREITDELGIQYDGRLMDVIDPLSDPTNLPADYSDEQLRKIISGEEKNYIIILRLTC